MCLGTAASWAGACSRKPGRPGTPAPEPAPPEPTSQRVAPFWRVTGVFRDEREVDALNGYDFDPPGLRRLFRAGAETARQRCLDVAVLLGIVPEGRIAPATRQRLFAWCGAELPDKTTLCEGLHPDDGEATELRTCGDALPGFLDQCGPPPTKMTCGTKP